jgi:hypothetical protein
MPLLHQAKHVFRQAAYAKQPIQLEHSRYQLVTGAAVVGKAEVGTPDTAAAAWAAHSLAAAVSTAAPGSLEVQRAAVGAGCGSLGGTVAGTQGTEPTPTAARPAAWVFPAPAGAEEAHSCNLEAVACADRCGWVPSGTHATKQTQSDIGNFQCTCVGEWQGQHALLPSSLGDGTDSKGCSRFSRRCSVDVGTLVTIVSGVCVASDQSPPVQRW